MCAARVRVWQVSAGSSCRRGPGCVAGGCGCDGGVCSLFCGRTQLSCLCRLGRQVRVEPAMPLVERTMEISTVDALRNALIEVRVCMHAYPHAHTCTHTRPSPDSVPPPLRASALTASAPRNCFRQPRPCKLECSCANSTERLLRFVGAGRRPIQCRVLLRTGERSVSHAVAHLRALSIQSHLAPAHREAGTMWSI